MREALPRLKVTVYVSACRVRVPVSSAVVVSVLVVLSTIVLPQMTECGYCEKVSSWPISGQSGRA